MLKHLLSLGCDLFSWGDSLGTLLFLAGSEIVVEVLEEGYDGGSLSRIPSYHRHLVVLNGI